MFGKIFSSMYEGSLHGKWQAIVTFQQLIVLANQHGEVDRSLPALASTTSIPLEILETGIRQLLEPDPESRSKEEEGRRIVLMDPSRSWGWRIVNYKHYREMRSAEERRAYLRQAKRDQRARDKAVDNIDRQHRSTKSTKAVSSKQEAGSSTAKGRARATEAEDPGEGEPAPVRAAPLDDDPRHQAVLRSLAGSQLGEVAVEAYLHYRREAGALPDAVTGELRMMAEGLRGPGGRAVSWDVLGAALHELRLAQAPFKGVTLRTFVQRLLDDAARTPRRTTDAIAAQHGI